MSMQKSRRDFLKKTGYSAPVVITLAATPALAAGGSAGGGVTSEGNCRTVTRYRTAIRVVSWWPFRVARVRIPVTVRVCS